MVQVDEVLYSETQNLTCTTCVVNTINADDLVPGH